MKINNKEYKITPVDKKAEVLCQKRWDSIAKPLHQSWKDGGLSGTDSRNYRGRQCEV